MSEIATLIQDALPGSVCNSDDETGLVSVAVQKNDTRGLPRLFAWIEQSARAAQVLKEWSISNTTLEQVFLMLCVQVRNREFD